MEMHVVQSLAGCVCVFVNEFFLWTPRMFSIQVSPAVILMKLKPSFYGILVRSSSRGLYRVRAVFCRDLSDGRKWRKFGELVDQNGNLSD